MPHTRSLRVELSVLDRSLVIEDHVPVGSVRPDELLPFMYHADNAMIGTAISKSETEGNHISCKKGCSACCRAQPVPVTPAEAHSIACDSWTHSRTAKNGNPRTLCGSGRTYQGRGLFDLLIREAPVEDKGTGSRRRATTSLGLVCPFLEDDACSILPAAVRLPPVSGSSRRSCASIRSRIRSMSCRCAGRRPERCSRPRSPSGRTLANSATRCGVEYDVRHRENSIDRRRGIDPRWWLAELA